MATQKRITLAIARLVLLVLAAKIWRHAGRVGVIYSGHHAAKGIMSADGPFARDRCRRPPLCARAVHTPAVDEDWCTDSDAPISQPLQQHRKRLRRSDNGPSGNQMRR